MKRWVLLLALPWSVVVSTREVNCTYVSDLPTDSTGYLETAHQKCETAEDWQLLYKGNPLVYCGPQSNDPALRENCEWMQDISASFNELALVRQSRDLPFDPGQSKKKNVKTYRVP